MFGQYGPPAGPASPTLTVPPTEVLPVAPPDSPPPGPAGAIPPGPPPPSPNGGSSVVGGGLVLPPRSSGTRKRYVGRRIDLDFRGADIHNILRLLADVGQVNIVTSDDVKGEVTIKMKNVPWDQALDVILRAKLLGQVREGNLIRVAPLTVLEKEVEADIARQRALNDVAPTETRLIAVSYAEAKLLRDRIKDLLSPRGRVSVDERTNQLIVSDVTRNLNLIEDLVRSLDTQTSAGDHRGAHRRGDVELHAPDRRAVGRLDLPRRQPRQPDRPGLPVQRRARRRRHRRHHAARRPGRQRRGQPQLRGQLAGRRSAPAAAARSA